MSECVLVLSYTENFTSFNTRLLMFSHAQRTYSREGKKMRIVKKNGIYHFGFIKKPKYTTRSWWQMKP